MIAAILDEQGFVINRIEVDELGEHPSGDFCSIGDKWDGSKFVKVEKPINKEQHNADILRQLEQNDFKTIRALREGDADRIALLEQTAIKLRSQMMK